MALHPPFTRAQEILRWRGLSQSEVARLAGWNVSNLSRVLNGKTKLTARSQRALATALDCTEANLHEPIGSPVPPRLPRSPPASDFTAFERRLRALLKICGIEAFEQVLPFLMAGDYRGLPPKIAARLRKLVDEQLPERK